MPTVRLFPARILEIVILSPFAASFITSITRN